MANSFKIRDTLSSERSELLARRLKGKGIHVQRATPVSRRTESGPCKLSFAQERLWFLDRLEPGSSVYNIASAVRLSGVLDVETLERSLNEIVKRHEALRTTFPEIDGEPLQVIAPELKLPLSVVELSEFPEVEREDRTRRLATEEARRPFDLSRGPLVRARLLRLSEDSEILLLTIHHIVSDGWSMGVLFQELAVLYEAFSSGKSSPLSELPIQYPDFALWQRNRLQGEVFSKQLSYWKHQLDGAPPVTEIATDHPRPQVQTYRGKRQFLVLPAALTEAIKTLSRREGVTLFMTLFGAFQTLLHRYTGQDDIVVGSPIAGRSQPETERLIGFFVNTLVLRTDFSGNPRFRELLHRVRKVALNAIAYHEVPFDRLVQELHPDRDLARNPLFQVMFAFQNFPGLPSELSSLTLTPMSIGTGTAKFDLTLYMAEKGNELKASMEYNSDLFESATITRMLGHFETLLEGIVANPNKRLSELPYLTEAERHELLAEWNNTRVDYPKDQCIHELFETQVERTPEAVAVVSEDRQLTYRELNRQANQLAHYLKKQGVGPETLVGICLERSVEMVLGLLGILKAGGAYVPLDPAYPQERLAFMVADARTPVVLTREDLVDGLSEHGAQVVCVDKDWAAIARHGDENLVTEKKADDAVYVIYTSGSTGTPKGVLGLHQGAVNRFMWMWETYPFRAGEICCQKTTLNFLDSVWEIFGPLLQGVRIVVIADETLKDPYQLVQSLAAHDVSRIVLVPSLLRVILNAYDDLQSKLPRLKMWVTSGEALSLELLQRFREKMPESTLINLYGSSEVSADSTWYDTNGSQSLSCVPIGRPIANTRVYILDRELRPVPIGVPGELHIGGDGLAQGYLNRPELTVEKFISDPFSGEASARLYKTGDLVRYLADGNMEFVGRLDHQVKIRGFRIELGEIETLLNDYPDVKESVVMAREDSTDEKRLVAYVVAKDFSAPAMKDMRLHLKKKLPDYMVPSAFVMLEALPLTPNGKVDRRALAEPEQARPELEETYVAPRNPVEEVLAEIWSDVLGLEALGVHDNFFELGGHSLLAVKLVHQIEKVLGSTLPVMALFQAPTVEQLAETLRKKEDPSRDWASVVPLQPNGSKPPFFFLAGPSHFGNRLGPDQPVYRVVYQDLDREQPLVRIEDMAAHSIKSVRAIQPEGPYYLGGHGLGGLVAFEMAHQLQRQGQKVALLALCESRAPGSRRPTPGTSLAYRLWQRARYYFDRARRIGPRQTLAYLLRGRGLKKKT
ncbi:MAG: amino acid adenylation domain-containing protein, partial [Ignavibacteria bacterium]|nr:amino acid adenylation domain-containing protein [Ignavibacteria bacterium]